MATGKVKWFDYQKKFGFITPDDSSRDIFVHQNGLKQEIRENDRVSYDVEQGKKGPNAVNVRLVSGSE